MKNAKILLVSKTVLPNGRELTHKGGMLKKKYSDRGINKWYQEIDREIEAEVYASSVMLNEAKSLLTPRR